MPARTPAACSIVRVIGLAMALAWAGSSAHAGETSLAFSGGNFSLPLVSLKEARFKSVIRQEHDFSCGSAAVATLLTHHYGRATSEQDAFQTMYATGDQAAIQRLGFSLYDMQRYLASLGYRADGYRVSLEKLVEVGVPAITLINTRGYNHFVVVKGVKDGDVLVGDPAMGLKAIPRAEFDAMWQGVMFVIHDDIDLGREHFNRTDEWAVRRKAPYGSALSRNGLMTFSVVMPGLFQF